MITKTTFRFYITYLVFSAIWLGAAFHDTASTNYTWYVDPLTYMEHTTAYNIPGAISPWPFSTMLLLIFSIIAAFLFKSYRGRGKKEAYISIIGSIVIIALTLIYFVPTLGKIFGENHHYDNESLIRMSRTWVILNIVRFFILVFLFVTGLRALAKFDKPELINK